MFGARINRLRRCVQTPITLSGAVLIATICLYGQVAERLPKRTFTHDRDVETGYIWHTMPRWDGEMLVGYDHDETSAPVIYTIDREGRHEETLFTIQDAARITIAHLAGSPKGEIAVIGGAYTGNGRFTSFLARIAADRKSQTITRTWPYCPNAVTFAPDGTLWTIGNLKDEEDTRDVVPAHLLRRFDSSGRMLGSLTVAVRGFHPDGSTYLTSSRDRVGWFTGEEYIEFSMDGYEIGRYDGPEGAIERDITGVALNEDNDVVAARFGRGKAEFVILNREQRTWNAISLPKDYAPKWAQLLGFDGTTLVVFTTNGTLRRFNTK